MAYACRIIAPGMSEIYPVDDLEYENNSLANNIREAILHLPVQHLYGAPTLQQAEALLKREQRFFNITAPGIRLDVTFMRLPWRLTLR